MVYFPAFLAAQPPDYHQHTPLVAIDNLAFPCAYYFKLSSAYRAYALFFAVYVKFPAASSSNWYRLIITILTHHPLGGIILGYSRAGNPVGCWAFGLGGDRYRT